jgi:hypothetical protein
MSLQAADDLVTVREEGVLERCYAPCAPRNSPSTKSLRRASVS